MGKEHVLSSGVALGTLLVVVQACGNGTTVWQDPGGGASGRATGGAGASSGAGGAPGGGASGSADESGGSTATGGGPEAGKSGSGGSSGAASAGGTDGLSGGGGAAGAGAGGQPSCDEIKAAYAAALRTASACAPGADACQVSVASSLDCGCPTYVDDDTELRPLIRDWKFGACARVCPLACLAAQPGNCGDTGHCVGAPQ